MPIKGIRPIVLNIKGNITLLVFLSIANKGSWKYKYDNKCSCKIFEIVNLINKLR